MSAISVLLVRTRTVLDKLCARRVQLAHTVSQLELEVLPIARSVLLSLSLYS